MSLKRFYVDLSMSGRGMTGVQLYSINLAQQLERAFDCRVLAPAYLCRHFAHPLECPPPLTLKGFPLCRNRLARGWSQVELGRDTLVYAPHMRGLYFQDRQVITIHDLIHHYYRTRNFVETAANVLLLPRLLPRLEAVFTVSQTVRRELCAFYGLDPERVQVVPNGIDLGRWTPAATRPRADTGYLLVVSANRPYKNTIELLERHPLWADRYRLKIVSTRARYGRAIRARVQELGLARRVDFLDDLPEQELIDLYRGCAALVYPSLMEGFGRPALEALAVGRPVILSDIAVHVESFGEAAIFVTPGEARSWEAAFAALQEPASLETRIARGLRIAAAYSWQAAGAKLIEALLAIEPELAGLRRR
jgi:glycosyltransferase involved in cell wall biosynthesis